MSKTGEYAKWYAWQLHAHAMVLQASIKELCEAIGPNTDSPVHIENLQRTVHEMDVAMGAIKATEYALRSMIAEALNRRNGE
jgi:hypothetical protein